MSMHIGSPPGVSSLEQLAEATADGTATSLTTATFGSRKYLYVVINCAGIAVGGNFSLRFNGTSTGLYNQRSSTDGAADATATNQSAITLEGNAVTSPGSVFIWINNNTTSQYKQGAFLAVRGASADNTAPNRREGVFNWENTTDQISTITFLSGDLIASGSTIKVYGSD